MTYNVKGLKLSRQDVVAVVRAEAPDVLAVQEPTRWPFGRLRMQRFARDVGMRMVVNGGGARTTALLVAPGHLVVNPHPIMLPRLSGRTRRGIAVATVDGIGFVNFHLSLVRDERAAHLSDILRDHVPATRAVVLGDLNERPYGPAWTSLTALLVDAGPLVSPTFPAIEPRHRIDAIFTTPDLRTENAQVPSDRPAQLGSDHRPVVVDVAHAPARG
jgi:endonuclease/exonuclease/phosphatase family metal-dependent hydrolase